MAKAITIPKDKSSFPEYLDFYNLREVGLRHIQELGGDIWTDHNLHDPGITVLEVLCYAITDLGYRTNFDIKDLLTQSKQAKKDAAKTIFKLPFDNNFFSAAHILSSNPLTVTDYRKLFIDIPGVKNAWLEKSETQEVRIGINCTKKELFTLPHDGNTETPELKLNGLYDICVEIEPQSVIDACGQTLESRNNIIKRVYEVYHAHRNLCEDVRDICIFGEEKIAICADIELTSEANPEEVMLQICLKVEEFLSPTLRFYTLQEMLDKGKTTEEIFEGRPLTADTENSEAGANCLPLIPSRGFIDVDELKKLDPKSVLHVSDVHNVVMQIEGVQAIHKLVLVNYINELPLTKGEKWCINLSKGYSPHIGISTSKINFFKGPLYFSYNNDIVVQRFAEEKNAKLKACLEPYQLDLPIPEGNYHDLQDYTSIQHEFPLTYGIGSDGINQPPTLLRKAQAKQLKGYLLFFDQILANYLSQLAHIRDLFDVRRDDSPARKSSTSTYFSQILKDVPDAEYLLKNLEACQPSCSIDTVPEDYPNYLSYITESQDDYQKHRNVFLDHLLARFSESFTDYVTQMYKIQKEERNEQFIINSKASFLENYPAISRNRSKALNILERPVWNTNDVSGLKKRISALLGITDSSRRTLSKGEVIDLKKNYFLQFSACNGVSLRSKEFFTNETAANKAAAGLIQLLNDKNNFQILEYTIPNLKGYGFTIIDSKGKVIARSVGHFTNSKALSENVDSLIQRFTENEIVFSYPNEKENFGYIVTDNDSNELLESAAIYFEKNKAEQSQDLLKSQAIARNNYCRINVEVENAKEYAFALVIKEVNTATILLQSDRYTTYAKAQEALYCLINGIALQKMTPEIVREVDCFEYWVLKASGEKLIFKSYNGYKTADLALHSPGENDIQSGYEKFEELAVDIDYYHSIVKDGKFGFELHKEKVSEENSGSFEIFEGRDAQVYFRLKSGDNTLMLISKGFESIQAAKNGIETLRESVTDDSSFETRDAKNEKFYFIVKDKTGKIICVSQKYSSKDDMQNDIQSLKNNALTDYVATIEIEAVHPFYYDTEQECDDRKWAAKYYVDNEPYQPAVIGGDPGNFILEIKDNKGKILLVSPPKDADFVYKTEVAAQRAHQKIRRRASDERKTYYELLADLEGDLPFGFMIKDRDNTIIANHPQQYASAEERNLAINVLIYGIRNQVASYRNIQEGEEYRFEMLSMDHNVLMRSELLYPSKDKSEEAWNEFLSQAGAYSNYLLSEKETSKEPKVFFEISMDENEDYFFKLKGAGGELMLQSEAYKTKQSCESGLKTLKSVATENENYERNKTKNNKFYFVLKAKNGKVLGTSANYATRSILESVLRSVLNNVATYTTTDTTLKNDEYPYSFSVLGVSKQVVATHTKNYRTKQERDLALQAIINYVSYTEYQENISGTSGSYTFALKGKKDFVLLESTVPYADEPSAIGAFKSMVNLAKERSKYNYLTNAFRFEIVNEDNQVIARPPENYEFKSENERDAAIELILAYLRNDTVNKKIENVAGAFYNEVTDSSYNQLLQGTVLSVLKKNAEAELAKLVGIKGNPNFPGFACNPENYQEEYFENQICPYGFSVVDDSDLPVARHPFQFHTKSGLNNAMFNVLSWMTDFNRLKEQIIKIRKWQNLLNWKNETLLQIDYAYLIEYGLTAIKQLALKKDNYSVEFKNSNYVLILKDSENEIVAKHPKYLTSEKVANDKAEEIILFFSVNGGSYDKPAQNKQFTIYDESGDAILVSTEKYSNEKTLVKAFSLGADQNKYKLVSKPVTVKVGEEDSAEFSFQLWNGNFHIADHPVYYENTEKRDEALSKVVTWLQTDWLTGRMKDIFNTWYYEIGDFAGKILLSSKNETEFDTSTKAQESYENAINLALDSENYKSVVRYQLVDPETKKCTYSFVIENTLQDGAGTLFTHEMEYDCIKDRNQSIQKIIDLLRPKQYKSGVKGTTCGYRYKLNCQYTPEEDANEIVVESAIYYPNRGEAQFAISKLVELMKSDENYIQIDEDENALWYIIDAHKRKQAKVYSDGDDEAVKQALINCVSYAKPDIEYTIENNDFNALYQLKDNNEILLQTGGNDIEEDCMEQSGIDIYEKSDKVAALGQSDKNYRIISSVGQCLHGFELLDKNGEQLAEHNLLYFSKTAANTVVDNIQDLLNSEGLHLVEHLLLRPRQTLLSPQYHWVIKVEGEVLMNGIMSEMPEEDTYQFVLNNFISILKQYSSKDSLIVQELENEELPTWNFQLETDGTIKGVSEKNYCSAEDLETDRDLVHNKLQELKDSLNQESLSKSEKKQILSEIVITNRTKNELEGDTFLPVPLLCTDENGDVCSELSDPYSFRATIVIPFWPKRFNDPQFREYMETTLRRETPAHILPRICWLDTCQMRVFEAAYRRWLETLDIKNDHCDALDARNALINVLKKLRSNYPEARLFSCAQDTTDNNILVLDNTRLG